MAHPPDPSRSGKQLLRGTLPTDPRYEIAFEEGVFQGALASRALGRVASLTGRLGEAIGDGYARAIGFMLEGVERFEDSSAERRLLQRRRGPRRHAGAPAASVPKPDQPLQK